MDRLAEIRGLFTDRLLRGLAGGAADASGTVQTSGLMAYLKNQQALVGDAPSANANAGPILDPVFPETSELVLAEVGADLPTYDLKTALPQGTILRVVEQRGGLTNEVGQGPVVGGVVALRLGLGIFKAIAPGMKDCLFEIASGTSREVHLA